MKKTVGVKPIVHYQRMSHIDAIRAVAVLLVMWAHYAELFAHISGRGHWLNSLQQAGNFGRIGVVIFFALSGLLIPKSLCGTLGEGTRKFLIRRVFRLYPAYWLSVPLGFFSYWMLDDKRLDFSAWVANLTMVPNALGRPAMMGHYWTLETELAFYALCLMLFWQGGIHRMRDLCATCVVLSVAFAVTSVLKLIPPSALSQYKGMLFHLSIMFWGACFQKAYDDPNGRVVVFGLPGIRKLYVDCSFKTALTGVTGMIAGVALFMSVIAFKRHDTQHMISSLSYLAGMSVFAMLTTICKIRAKLFVWLGEISYSLYLLHGIPLYLLYWGCKHVGWVGGPLGMYMVAAGVLAIGLSWLCFRAVEMPCMQFARALAQARRTNEANDTAQATQF
jgi:peptidoglycan/LPS O-acetylase OafA/YrhL